MDVSQAFDRVWIDGLIYKVSQYLPRHYVDITSSYLRNRQFQVNYGNAYSSNQPINAGVPQGSVLGPIFYILYTVHIPETKSTVTVTFADDTAILSPHKDYETATENLQEAVNKLTEWTTKWKIRLNSSKSVRVNFSLCQHHDTSTTLNGEEIPAELHAKSLGVYRDSRLTRQKHIKTICEEIKIRFQTLFWLLRTRNKLFLPKKRPIYVSVIRPMWTYAAPIWGCIADSNILILQRVQNNILRKITGAPWFIRNDSLHSDLQLEIVKQLIARLANSYKKRLHQHPNTLAIQLLEAPPIIRLHRKIPRDIIVNQ